MIDTPLNDKCSGKISHGAIHNSGELHAWGK